jgi:hypothetical protein
VGEVREAIALSAAGARRRAVVAAG